MVDCDQDTVTTPHPDDYNLIPGPLLVELRVCLKQAKGSAGSELAEGFFHFFVHLLADYRAHMVLADRPGGGTIARFDWAAWVAARPHKEQAFCKALSLRQSTVQFMQYRADDISEGRSTEAHRFERMLGQWSVGERSQSAAALKTRIREKFKVSARRKGARAEASAASQQLGPRGWGADVLRRRLGRWPWSLPSVAGCRGRDPSPRQRHAPRSPRSGRRAVPSRTPREHAVHFVCGSLPPMLLHRPLRGGRSTHRHRHLHAGPRGCSG